VDSRRLNWFTPALTSTVQSASIVATVLIVLLTAASSFAASETEPPLLTLEQFCKLDRSAVTKREAVRVRGTVTFINREWELAVIQEDDCAIKVSMETDADLEFGQLVELTGRTEFGDDSNILMLTGASVLGEGSIPDPQRLDETLPFSVDLLYRWSGIEGHVYSAVADETKYYIHVAGKEFGLFVMLPRTPNLPPVKALRNYRIYVQGVPTMSTEEGRPFRVDLQVPVESIADFTLEKVSKNGIRLRPLAETGRRDMRGDAESPARFRAVVRSVFPPNRLFLSDESGPLFVELDDSSASGQFSVGDVIDVEGRIDRRLKQPFLRDAHARLLGKGYSEPPTNISPRIGHASTAKLVQVTGMLVASDRVKNWVLLRDGGTYFRVWYQPAFENQIENAGVGSQISVAGGCWLSPSDDSAFDILARDATVLFNIPATNFVAETVDDSTDLTVTNETADAASATAGDIIRPVLLTLLLIFLGTLIWLVNRRLKEQERFQESIHEQLSNLSHIARLNTLSEMVGALAHELNQPLASVSNYAATAELLSKKQPTDTDKLAGILTHIGKEAFRAGEIIRRLRYLVRKKTPGSLPVQISEIIHETVELFKTQHVTASGLVQVDVPDDLPFVQADSVQIQQVILNLLLNARDATEAEPERASEIQVASKFEDGQVTVSVSDNGIGVASSTPDAIFEPYFTTREKGTGLGLAISRTIIESHAGRITAEKGTPHGTRITFSLPVSRAQANIAG